MEGRRVYKIGHQGGTMVTQLWFITGLLWMVLGHIIQQDVMDLQTIQVSSLIMLDKCLL
jgi:uncharacterized membrane protein YccF (DUF307 family)